MDGATAGTLSIMLGGAPDAAAIAAEILSACGTPVLLGPLRAGEVAKACNQLVVSAMWELLSGGYAGSRLLESRRDKLVTGDDSPSSMAVYMVKDLRFAADIADATGTSAVLLPTLRAAFDELVEAGLGERDIAVSRRFVASRDTRAR
ncbi:NAD-binding protein [Microbacterium sp. SD291]|uniref:NAD-binding protein n=1 Tax=Microbacterium sp. SD291 TaxID=2782007 RepID=UPI001F611A0A|nr:NAD-binding protein [Microbacterium sp. SD291]